MGVFATAFGLAWDSVVTGVGNRARSSARRTAQNPLGDPVRRFRQQPPLISDEDLPHDGEQQDDGECAGEQPAHDEQPDVPTPAGLERDDLGHLDAWFFVTRPNKYRGEGG